LLVHESVSLCEELLKIGTQAYAEGEIITPARICVERTHFPVDSVTNRLNVVFSCVGDKDGELISAKRARMSDCRKESLSSMEASTSARLPS
jgi:hypothetical protein